MNLSRALVTLVSLIRRRPALVALAGLLATFLTPFVFFPEIMGDVGVTHASALRNGAALVFLATCVLVTVLGLGTLGWRLVARRKMSA